MRSAPPPSCRLFGILASEAPVAVLLRRGPTDWVEFIRWDTAGDTFERGQWFHGRIYERRGDLSPDGALFVYFAARHGARQRDSDYTETWTALSRPPWLTALTLWPKGDCWDGGGRFDTAHPWRSGTYALHLNHFGPVPTHPKHPAPKHLRVTPNTHGRGEDLPIYDDILQGKGWRREEAGNSKGELRALRGSHVWTKPEPQGRLVLRMELESIDFRRPGGPLHFGFALLRASDGELVDVLDAQWADWDQAGRLVHSNGGKLFATRVAGTKGQHRDTVELADFTGDTPAQVIAPERATRW
ncbi:hypothetical protein [Archangium sp.]|uniref:hypothetical protein n=1 Tax=Archangium sp. TaxID=1872627 RepID=UPI003899A559